MNSFNDQELHDQIILNDRRGSAAYDQGEYEECKGHFAANLRICRLRVELLSEHSRPHADLAVCLERLAKVEEALQNFADAASYAGESVEMRRGLLEENSNDAQAILAYSSACARAAGLEQKTGRLAQADQLLSEASKAATSLYERDRANAEYQEELAKIRYWQGGTAFAVGDLARARFYTAEAVRLAVSLGDDDPTNLFTQGLLRELHTQMADILINEDDISAASDHLQKAADIIEHICEIDVDEIGLLASLTVTRERLSIIAREQGDLAQAEQAASNWVQSCQLLSEKVPSYLPYVLQYATAYLEYARLMRAHGQMSKAELCAGTALSILQELTDSHDNLQAQFLHIRVYEQLGLIAAARNDFGGAEHAYRQALGIEEVLSQADPAEFEYRRSEGTLWQRIADARLSIGDIFDATAAYLKHIELAENVVADFPDNPLAVQDLVMAHIQTGNGSRKMGDLESRLYHYAQAHLAIQEMRKRGVPISLDLEKLENQLAEQTE